MNQYPMIVFVCEHGVAKSVVAAAHFNKLASENNLAIGAIAGGTTPDAALSPMALTGLISDGLTPSESVPQKISRKDVEFALRIVSFCDIPEEFQGNTIVERWDNIPPVSENYEKARDAIIERVNQLFKN